MRRPDGALLLCANCGQETATAAAPTAAGAATDRSLQDMPRANGIPANGCAGSSDSEAEEEPHLLEPPPTLSARLRASLPPADQPGSRAPTSAAGSATPSRGGNTMQAAQLGSGGLPLSSRQPGGSARVAPQAGHDASKEIAELMLEGWAMLADHCPRCLNPLLRSRERRIYCAGCQLYVVREGAAPPNTAQQPASRQQLQAHRAQGRPAGSEGARQAGVAQAAAAAASSGVAGVGARVPGSATTPPPAAPALQAAAPASQDARPSAVPAGRAGQPQAPTAALQQHLPALDAAAAAVAARLSAATASLESAAGASGAAHHLVELQHCAATLQALAECWRSMAG